jgi:hypothetical protein
MHNVLSRIPNRRLAVSLGLLIILAAVVIDLAFSGNPGLSIGILVVFVIISVTRRSKFGRVWPRGPDKQR